MRERLVNEILEKLNLCNMKYAAMDKNKKWYAFEQRPDCVDDMWDTKHGDFIRLYTLPGKGVDYQKSLVEKI